MIVFDTNVWSETVKPEPDARAMTWIREHADQAAITSVTVGELLAGVEVMGEGRRREGLRTAIEQMVVSAGDRALPYDVAAAAAYARISGDRRRSGRSQAKPEDAMIAAIAQVRGCAVATRNVRDFDGMGVEIINPWAA